jgi:hypothetical protein
MVGGAWSWRLFFRLSLPATSVRRNGDMQGFPQETVNASATALSFVRRMGAVYGIDSFVELRQETESL